MHDEAGINQILDTYAVASVLWNQARVTDLFDHILLPGPGFAGDIANHFGGDWHIFDPEENGLLVEANYFASEQGFVVGWLAVHGWTPCKLSLPLQNPIHPNLIASRDDLMKVTFRDVTFLNKVGVDPQNVDLFCLAFTTASSEPTV